MSNKRKANSLFMKEKFLRFRRENPRLYEGLAYLVFGVLTTLVNWLTYLLLTSVLGLSGHEKESFPYWLIANLSQAIAWVISVVFAYFTNRSFVFQGQTRQSSRRREFWLFLSSRALGFFIFDILLFNAFLLMMADRPAKLIMNVLVIIYNYLVSRFVIFGKKPKRKRPKEDS